MAQKGEWITNTYRAGVVAGIGAILWANIHYVPTQRFEDFKEAHAESMKQFAESIRENKASMIRLEAKIDVLLREHKQAMLYQKRLLEDLYE